VRRGEPCAHLHPDYDRLEQAHHIRRDSVTDEISWPPTGMMNELARLGLMYNEEKETDHE
jgi:hypothetical protein